MRSEPWICLRKNQNKEKEPFLKIASLGTLARVLKSLGVLYKILDLRVLVTETAIEMFLENGSTFYNSQIILLNIVLQRSSYAQNCQAVYQI